MQDVCVKISLAGPGRSTCGRSVYEDLLRKVFVSRPPRILGALMQDRCADLLSKISLSVSLHQDPVVPLAQDLCLRISCARCLCQDVCVRIPSDHLCKVSVCADLLSKISLSGSLRQDPVEPLAQDLCIRILYDHLRKISV